MGGVRGTLRSYDGDEPFVFVSYAHSDAARVYPLLAMLAGNGIRIWFDEGIAPGNPWRDELASAIDRCRVFLYLLTEESATSRNCQRECSYALDRDKRMLTVYLDDLDLPQGLKLSLSDQQAILAHSYSRPLFEEKLLDAMGRLLDAPVPESAGEPSQRRAAGGHNRYLASASWYPARRWRVGTAIALPAAALLGAAFGWWLHGRVSPVPEPAIVEVRRLTGTVGLEEMPALSPDGATVAFVATESGRRQIWVRLVSGGEPIPVTDPGVDSYAPRWSPDSSSLVYYTPGEELGQPGAIWERPALGGAPRRIVNALGPGDISHDGLDIAFFRADGGDVELTIVGRDEARTRTIARLPSGLYSDVRWSPDDQSLAFLRDPGGASFSSGLHIIPAGGGEPRLISDEYFLRGIDWLPDGSGIVASSARGSLMSYPPTFNLWTIPIDGSPSLQLTFGEVSYEYPDVIDGQLVASRSRIQSDVWRFPVGGSPAENALAGERITRQTGVLQTLSLSPDESEAVYLSDAGGHANVWAARIADGTQRQITREADPQTIVAVPVWSPRGDWIAFLSSRNSASAVVTLWLSRPDGSEQNDLGIFGTWACWSPDGSWLYFTVRTDEAYELRKLPVAGGDQVTVRTDDALGCGLHGTTLYYARPLVNELGLWDLEVRVADSEAGESRLLGRVAGNRVPSAAVDFQGVPSPDGEWLAAALRDGSTTNLWTLSTATGEWRQITDFGDRNVMIARRIDWSRDGAYLYASVSDLDSDIVMLSGLFGDPPQSGR